MQFKNVQHGLSNRTVHCFHQDEFGFLWIGTQDGLNRFDGVSFDVFKPEKGNPNSIKVNDIRQICGNDNGLLFILSLNSVEVYDMTINQFSTLREGRLTSISYSDGALLVSENNKIYRYSDINEEPDVFFDAQDIQDGIYKDTRISKFIVCQDKSLAIATANYGIFRIDEKGQIKEQIEDIESVHSLTEDSNKNLWVATRYDGLYRVRPDGRISHYEYSEERKNTINSDNVRQVVQVNDSLMYIGSFAGLQALNTNTNKFTDYKYELSSEKVAVRSILTMYFDRSGTLWMGSYYQGILYYNVDNDIYQYYRPIVTQGDNVGVGVISSMAEDNQGRVWVGIEGGGLCYYDYGSMRFWPSRRALKSKLGFNYVKSLHYDKKNNDLWVASLTAGVRRINMDTGEMETISKVVQNPRRANKEAYNIVKMIEFQGTDSLLLAARGGVLVLDKKTHKITPLSISSPLMNSIYQVWDLVFDRQGNLWVATSHELIRMNLERSSIRSYRYSEISQSYNQYNISTLLCDASGRIWLGSTGSGMYLYDRANDSFINYGEEKGLDNGFVTNIIENKQDNSIYVSTNMGLSKFNIDNEVFENYSMHSDFPLENVNRGGLFLSSENKLFASGLGGIVAIPQERLNKKAVDYDVFIKRVLVDNHEVCPMDSLRLVSKTSLYNHNLVLSPFSSVVTFDIACNILNNVSNVGLKYKLEGFDKDFINVTDDLSISYSNLKPGHYVFILSGTQEQVGGVSAPELRYELTIQAPVYMRAWFVVLIILILGIAGYYVLRLLWARQSLQYSLLSEQREKEYLESVNQSKQRFYTNISHEFRTPLTLISSQLELLLSSKDVLPSVSDTVKNILKHSNRMNSIVDEVLDIRMQDQGYLKLEIAKEDIVDIMQEIYQSFYDYAELRKIDLRFNTTLKHEYVYIDKKQMEKVFYNLLSNAFKFTKEGDFISIDLVLEGDDVVVEVRNQGVGIEKAKLDRVFDRFWQDTSSTTVSAVRGSGIGLSITKAIVEQHNGIISVDSEVDKETVFTVRLSRSANEDKVLASSGEDKIVASYKVDLERSSEYMDQQDKEVKILVVEDDPDVRKVLFDIFDPIYEVVLAENGQQGYDLACSLQPQLILSDIMMPIMSGLEMSEKLKSGIETSHIPIILLTARSSQENTLEGLCTGADDYVSKPFSINVLKVKCANIIRSRKMLSERIALGQQEGDNQVIENSTLSSIDKKIFQSATAIVEQHIDNPDFNVVVFARELCMSRTLLFSKLKALTGQTPNEFILSIRLQKATAKLQKEPDILIADIAFEFGFSSASYFIKCFKNFHGVTPSAFRKQCSK